MSFTIRLGMSTDDPRTIGKTIRATDPIAAEMKDPTDLIDPVFIISYTPIVQNANYVDFTPPPNDIQNPKRVYFIRSVELMPGGKMAIHCHEDVLTTFGGTICACRGTIDRTEDRSQINYFLYDPEVKPYQYTRTWTKSFSSVLPPQSFANIYLTTVG